MRLEYRAELDHTIFSLDKAKRLVQLKKQLDYVIKRMNADLEKSSFGLNSNLQAIDFQDMTYAEVIPRMIELMYVKHESLCVDPSLSQLNGDFTRLPLRPRRPYSKTTPI